MFNVQITIVKYVNGLNFYCFGGEVNLPEKSAFRLVAADLKEE